VRDRRRRSSGRLDKNTDIFWTIDNGAWPRDLVDPPEEVLQTRWLIFGGAGNSIQTPFLLVMVFWLAALFLSFGLLAPRNATVVAVLLVAALSVSSSLFLILEMNHPLQGMLKVPSAPLRFTLSHLGE
jgi:hypothetical protein